MTTCSPPVPLLDQIETTQVLRMATINSATTYYLGPAGPTGFEYDLGRRFAAAIGAELEVVVVPNRQAALRAIRGGRAHLAAGLAATPRRSRLARFAPPYLETQPQVVVHADQKTPTDMAALDGKLVVPGHTAIAAWLASEYPELNFKTEANANGEELLVRVARGEIAATVAGSDLVKLNQRYFPQLRVAFDVDTHIQRAWAFPARRGDALFSEAVAFFQRLRESKYLQVVHNRYFGHADRLSFVGGKAFARVVEERLGRWRENFKQAGKAVGFDWRLLAAMGYQESHWNPDAVSPTGVEGLMMLTERTARELGVSDRTDPQQSIRGGARYIRKMRQRLPATTKEPDRTWMALAAYNIGMGHVLDARRLLRTRGRDPDLWVNVREALLWLTQERYHSETRYGYARGQEAVAYVGNIRAYYDVLLWMTGDSKTPKPDSLTTKEAGRKTPGERALQIDTPAL